MTHQDGRTTVALIFGGVSSEHEISCLTAGGVARVIDPERIELVGVGIGKDGRWGRMSADDVAAFDSDGTVLPVVPGGLPEAVLLRGGHGGQVATRDGDKLSDVRDIDVAFTLLHGPFGEDGTIQGLFEMLGIRYVGAGVAASAIGMDKDLMKRAIRAVGVPAWPWLSFDAFELRHDRGACERAVDELGYPVFVKPARGGSSVGITRVNERENLAGAIELALTYDPGKIVVEKGAIGYREIEVGVLQGRAGGPPRVTVPGEIKVHNPDSFYDFKTKYLPGEEDVSLIVPAPLSDETIRAAQDVAARTFTALGTEGLARVDLFLSPDGDVFVNEINTMPGFTSLSMFPMLWGQAGLAYSDLVAELIDLAKARPLGLR